MLSLRLQFAKFSLQFLTQFIFNAKEYSRHVVKNMKPIYLFLTVQLNPTCLFLLFVFLLWGVRLFQPAAAIVSFLLFFNFNICSEDVFSFDLILASEQKTQKKKEK